MVVAVRGRPRLPPATFSVRELLRGEARRGGGVHYGEWPGGQGRPGRADVEAAEVPSHPA